MTLSTLDWIILALIIVSGGFGLLRGFTASMLSLISWLVAIWLPFHFADQFSAFLPLTVEDDTLRKAISALTLFIGAFVMLSLISFLIRKVIGVTGLGLIDRLLGVGLGLVRGAIIVALLGMLGAAMFPSIEKESWWNESRLMPVAMKVSDRVRARLPADLPRLFARGI